MLEWNSENQKLKSFLLAEWEPVILWQRGGYSQIRYIKKIQKHPSTKFLTIVVMHQQVVKFVGMEFQKSEIGDAFALPTQPQLRMLWQNGGYGWIQCIKIVYSHPSTPF